jgi:uncharacterized protein (TIGR00369 family)
MTDPTDGAVPGLAAHWRRLEHMYHVAPVNDYFEPKMEVSEGAAVLRMPVKSSSFHAAGSLHGSVLFKALDDAAIFAAYSLEPSVFVVTTSFTTYLLKPVSAGELVTTGTVKSRSGRFFVAHSEARCEGEVVAHGSGIFTTTGIALDSLPSYADAPVG